VTTKLWVRDGPTARQAIDNSPSLQLDYLDLY
jgi:hypothetical protein